MSKNDLIERLRALARCEHSDVSVAEEAADALEAAWEEVAALGWQEGEDPATEGLYVARDSKDNVEVGMWYAKTTNSWPAEWGRDFRDVDRDDIVAWMAIPDWRAKGD